MKTLICLAAAAAFAAGTFSHAAPAPRRIVVISGEFEYSSMLTMSALADELKSQPGLEVTYLQRTAGEDIPGLDALKHADLLIAFIRRMTLPPEQLALFRDYLQAGHPLIGIRTMCHAFQNWKEFDHEVLGGNYHDHYAGPHQARDHVEPAQRGNPILAGFPDENPSRRSLYKTSPLVDDATPLLYGTLDDVPEAREPLAWTRMYHGGRIFYTSLGDPRDFQHEPFMRLLGNAIGWALNDQAFADRRPLHPVASFPAHAVTLEGLPNYLGFSSYVFLDVRPAAEFDKAHAKKAVNLDPHSGAFETQLKQFDPEHNYFIYGDSGPAAAAVAARLHDLGFPAVNYLDAPYASVPAARPKP